MNRGLIGNTGQWLSVLIMACGIAMFIHYKMDYGTILFASGCLVATISTKLKYYGDEYVERNKKILSIIIYNEVNKKAEKTTVGRAHISDISIIEGGYNGSNL